MSGRTRHPPVEVQTRQVALVICATWPCRDLRRRARTIRTMSDDETWFELRPGGGDAVTAERYATRPAAEQAATRDADPAAGCCSSSRSRNAGRTMARPSRRGWSGASRPRSRPRRTRPRSTICTSCRGALRSSEAGRERGSARDGTEHSCSGGVRGRHARLRVAKPERPILRRDGRSRARRARARRDPGAAGESHVLLGQPRARRGSCSLAGRRRGARTPGALRRGDDARGARAAEDVGRA